MGDLWIYVLYRLHLIDFTFGYYDIYHKILNSVKSAAFSLLLLRFMTDLKHLLFYKHTLCVTVGTPHVLRECLLSGEH